MIQDPATITLTNGLKAIVDAEDLERVQNYRWRANWSNRARCYYAATGKSTMMHRLILNAPRDRLVDHVRHNQDPTLSGLDNRKDNLRLCTPSQNAANAIRKRRSKSPYKGIWWIEENKKWRARIRVNYKHISLGCFKTAKEAAMAYDTAAIKYFGEFAYLNFPATEGK